VVGRVLTVALLSALASLSQGPTSTLTGTVLDQTGAALSNAEVRVDGQSGAEKMVNADKSGEFLFRDLAREPINSKLISKDFGRNKFGTSSFAQANRKRFPRSRFA
jgi:hypothetical protein